MRQFSDVITNQDTIQRRGAGEACFPFESNSRYEITCEFGETNERCLTSFETKTGEYTRRHQKVESPEIAAIAPSVVSLRSLGFASR
jgi:hypothetical protein